MDETKLGRGKLSLGQNLALQILNLIPLGWRIRFFEVLGLLAYFLDGKHRRIAKRNLLLAFPEYQPRQISLLARKVFRNIGRISAEFTFVPRLKQQNIHRYVSVEGLENFHQARAKGRGVLFLTAHFGNWECMGATFPLLGGNKIYAVVRPLDSPFLNGLVNALRTWTGNQTIPKQKSMGRLLRLLRKGESLGILLDQNMAWQEGVFVDFFGEQACTHVGLALLAMRTEAPVLPIFNIRQPDGRYRIVVDPEVPLIRTGQRERDLEQNTQQYTAIIERYIRLHPDHWFWVHQRWKTRPWQVERRRQFEA